MKEPKSCVQCGKCLDVCPLFKVTGKEEFTPRAKFFLESMKDQGELQGKDFKKLASMCLSCGRCERNCPQNMSGSKLVSELRHNSKGFQQKCWDMWLSSPSVLWPMAATFSKAIPTFLPEPFGSASKSMQPLFENSVEPSVKIIPQMTKDFKSAVLYKGCVGRFGRKDWSKKAAKLMHEAGIEVLSDSDFGCCGSSMGSAGLLDQQKTSRKKNIEAWKKLKFPRMVVFCATCLKGLKQVAIEDFDGDKELYEQWQKSIVPLSSLLLDAQIVLEENFPQQIIYHKPCHVTDYDYDYELLKKVAKERLLDVQEDLCCGFGGIMQLGNKELSNRVGKSCISSLTKKAKKGATILSGCSACVVQISSLAGDDFFSGHLLDILK